MVRALEALQREVQALNRDRLRESLEGVGALSKDAGPPATFAKVGLCS